MNTIPSKLRRDDSMKIKYFLLMIGVIFCISSFFMSPPNEIFSGMKRIILHSDRLITDYVEVAGFGATFLNAGLLILISVILLHISKAKVSGMAIAGVFLMGGFGMFGKNIINIWGIILGVYLYSRHQKHPFSQYLFVAFFGTCLAPLTTEIAIWTQDFQFSWILAFGIGVIVGFLLSPVSNFSLSVHQGYNLYNVGFGAGLIGTVAAALMGSFGYTSKPQLIWFEGYSLFVTSFLYLLFFTMLIWGFLSKTNCTSEYKYILKKSGRLISDFVASNGFDIVLFNMGLLGLIFTTYVLLVGGHLNGPTIGGILTIVGFGGFGKHVKNTIAITLGVILGTIVKVWHINDPAVLLGALFGTGLAPIAGQFGFRYGILAGFIHLSVVLSVSSFHGGMNLYNNGFSAGLVALFLIPIIETFHKSKEKEE